MKIIQSFWTKPIYQEKNHGDKDRLFGGWPSQKAHLCSWILSCLTLKKFYEKVELITDERGKRLLVDLLGLPYTNVIVALDQFNGMHPDLWAIGKIFAYSIQDQPFIHVDSDVYIGKKFENRLENAQLIAQNIDVNIELYKRVLAEIICEKFFFPSFITDNPHIFEKPLAVNAGILGGKNIAFFSTYTAEAFNFLKKNLDKISQVHIPSLNIIFEQFLFFYLAEGLSLPISTLFEPLAPENPSPVLQIWAAPERAKYVHIVSSAKQNSYNCRSMEYWVRKEFPEYFYRLSAYTELLEV